jgi:SAM-dependent methyltransferase
MHYARDIRLWFARMFADRVALVSCYVWLRSEHDRILGNSLQQDANDVGPWAYCFRPGIGYGRNAKPFIERGIAVTGIEISGTAIALARAELGMQFPIHHGSVSNMPFDDRTYDGIYCHGLLYLLDAAGRAKCLEDCRRQLAPGGEMVFTLISKDAPMYAQGPKLGEDWYERLPGLPMYFYDEHSVRREFGADAQLSATSELAHGVSIPFLQVVCKNV